MRVVIDTNVIYSALRSESGASNALLQQVGTGQFEMMLSVPLVLEYESVLKREALQIGYTVEDVETLLNYLCAAATSQRIHFLWRPQVRDAKDDMVLELAANAACEYIITFNLRDFNLRDFRGSERFGVQVITPAQFLALLGGST
ncbi:putative toxin-antitoxin system toxin component, PIN family [Deinococcus psychrotolerans]|uniref:Putative toxin-antitoxin system toxin component, PIN family n=1 Tax=Deinococcus psychrotolerans TaxID=2489213 RepID=A0A3G8YE76_9DEIO|nr:putative toxin-antitoxin system toxin component, PIN family [Deinococcus psychrotolerans]AZI43243.1 putative toxin-antitoxin system toxin component, PIN family [Deinococcus psychrotolerans]